MQKPGYISKIFIPILMSIYSCQNSYCGVQVNQSNMYLEFERLVQDKENAKAIEIGRDLFEKLVSAHTENPSLRDLQRRLQVADTLAELITKGLESRQKKSLHDIVSLDILPELPPIRKHEEESEYLLPPAQQLYWTYLEPFSDELNIQGLSATESKFLWKYYDFRMLFWIEEVANITSQVIITNPELSDLSYYRVVLPLLYLSEQAHTSHEPAFLSALIGSDNLDLMSDFCLLQVERPNTARAIAKYKAKSEGRSFSTVDWSLAASAKCVENHRPDLAEKLLSAALDDLSDKDKVVELKLKVAENYGRCGDNMTAAEKCRQIAKDFPDSSLCGKAMYSYFVYLAKQSKVEQILAEIDSSLQSPRCQGYLPQLFYLKWWALLKTDQEVLANQIGQKLVEDYGSDPCVAPVLLAQATDALSNQHYEECRKLLVQLIRNFPQTNSAEQARKILPRLENK